MAAARNYSLTVYSIRISFIFRLFLLVASLAAAIACHQTQALRSSYNLAYETPLGRAIGGCPHLVCKTQ